MNTSETREWLVEYFNKHHSGRWPAGTIWKVSTQWKPKRYVVMPDRGLAWVWKFTQGEVKRLREEFNPDQNLDQNIN